MNSSELREAWKQLCDVFYDQTVIQPLDLSGLSAINNAEIRFANALRALWPQFRSGRVGPPEGAEPPAVRRGVKIILTLEDLDL